MLKLDEKALEVLKILEQEGITYTDVLVYHSFLLQADAKLTNAPNDFAEELENLIHIPKKKK